VQGGDVLGVHLPLRLRPSKGTKLLIWLWQPDEDVVVVDMVSACEFDEALTALDDVHAKVMLMVWKQSMQRPDGYFCTKVDLMSMARQVPHMEAALKAEHGAS